MKKILLTFLCCICSMQVIWSQEKNKNMNGVYGSVCDYITHQKIYGVKSELLSKDSIVLTSSINNPGQGIYDVMGPFILIVKEPGDYILRFSKEGYETLCVDWKIDKFYKRMPAIRHPNVYLKKKIKQRNLNVVTVTATKVKFYHKGDTLIFNADAFQLQEGSMLDALIRQLPGVELKEDGRIYVNGKYVESLLLNGEDFFKKDRSVMLENLPAYMVKSVNLYKKDGDLSKLLNLKTGDEQYVMDVRLKKQYTVGWMGNAEAAGGTDNRYLARLFALRFTDHSRLSFFASTNNVNEYVKPGEGSEWRPSVGSGVTTTHNCGVDYLIHERNNRYKLEGNVEVRYSNDLHTQHGNSETYLNEGNLYSLSSRNNRTHNLSLTSYHTFEFNWDKAKTNIKPSVFFVRNNQKQSEMNGMLSISPSNITCTVDSLFSPSLSPEKLSKIINRYGMHSKYTGHNMTASIYTQTALSLPYTMDKILFELNGNYVDNKHELFSHKEYSYPSTDSKAVDFRNEYNEQPYQAYSYTAKASYWYLFQNNWLMQPYYEFSQHYTKQENTLMRLDRIDGWDEETEDNFGQLPSVTDWKQTALDTYNSVYATLYNDYHTLGLYFHKNTFRENYWTWTFNLPLHFDKDQLDYTRPTMVDTTIIRQKFYFRPSLRGNNAWYKKDQDGRIFVQHELSFGYSLNVNAQPINYAVRLYDNSNPLSILQTGNKLKDSWTHKANATYRWSNSDTQQQIGTNAEWQLVQNALAMQSVYDPKTGMKTVTPNTVNGNWTLNGGIKYSFPIDRRKRLTAEIGTSASYNHNVDYAGYTESVIRSIVKSTNWSQNVRFTYRPTSKVQLGVRASNAWVYATSPLKDFNTIHAADFNYGITAQIELPWQIQVSTDFTVYSRRGYEDRQMNTDDLIWNARLSKRLLKNRLSIMVDGFDLLGQLSNIKRVLNAQGRTETWYNSIQRYAMLHILYKFSVAPQKK